MSKHSIRTRVVTLLAGSAMGIGIVICASGGNGGAGGAALAMGVPTIPSVAGAAHTVSPDGHKF